MTSCTDDIFFDDKAVKIHNTEIALFQILTTTFNHFFPELRANPDVKNQVLEVGVCHPTFWTDTNCEADLVKPVATAILFGDGDEISLSVLSHILTHVEAEINHRSSGDHSIGLMKRHS